MAAPVPMKRAADLIEKGYEQSQRGSNYHEGGYALQSA